MRKHVWTVHVPTDPASLWDYLVDYSNQLGLCGEGASATLIAGVKGQVGATYRVVMPWEGLKGEFETQLESVDPPRYMKWASSTGQSQGSAVYELAPSKDGGTDMAMEVTLELRGAFAPLEPFGWTLMSRFAQTMVDGLKRTFPGSA